MKVNSTNFDGLYLIQPSILSDNRGYFFESFNELKFRSHGLDFKFIQDNHSYSLKNVVRGLHFQKTPYPQTKLVRSIKGCILDVVVDVREGSKTFGMHFSTILSDENHTQLLVPAGFAHGFSVLSEFAIVSFKVDHPYNKESEVGIRFDDETLNIDWKISNNDCIITERDRKLNSFIDTIPFKNKI